MERLKCCICGVNITGHGNSPEGAAWLDDNDEVVIREFPKGSRCCNKCDEKFVTPGRIYRFYRYTQVPKTILHKLKED